MATPKEPTRSVKTRQDLGSIPAIEYNDSAGAKKVIIVEPAYVKATTAGENIGIGRLVKISASPYNLELKNKAYSAAATYQIGDVATEGGNVYLCMQKVDTPEAFDPTKWRRVADTVITGIISTAGAVVSTGRWHNSVSVTGWLVDDDSKIDYIRIRD